MCDSLCQQARPNGIQPGYDGPTETLRLAHFHFVWWDANPRSTADNPLANRRTARRRLYCLGTSGSLANGYGTPLSKQETPRNIAVSRGFRGEAPPGFEPGMADLQSAAQSPQAPQPQAVSETTAGQRSECAAPAVEVASMDPDLAAVNSSWPGLPTHIKTAILALVQAAKGPVKP